MQPTEPKFERSQLLSSIAILCISLLVFFAIVFWFFFRIEIPKGKFGVVIYKGGLFGGGLPLNKPGDYDPTQHHFLNKEETLLVKGIQAKILPEGWHFLNPLYYDVEIHPAQTIEKNTVGVVFAKDGELIKNIEETILSKKGERGVQEEVLSPGTYRFNPYLENVEVQDLQQVPSNKLGVVISYDGKKPKQEREGKEPAWRLLAEKGEKGIQKGESDPAKLFASPLKEAQYKEYSNPYAYKIEKIDKISIGNKQLGVLIAQDGKIPSNTTQILVDNRNVDPKNRVKGIEKGLLTQGEHAVNIYQYSIEIKERAEIPSNKVGIKIAQDGALPSSGSTLSSVGEKGIQRNFLSSGSTELINPYEYDLEIVDWVKIPEGSIGVVTSYVGKDPEVLHGKIQLANPGERGVQKETLNPGNHYINPYEKEIEVINIQSHNFQLADQDELVFPSKDGFVMGVDVSTEWQIDPEKVPDVLMNIGNEKDILDKVVRPNMVSAGRIQGSKFTAEEFILGDSREAFQKEIRNEISKSCEKHGIIVHGVMVRNIKSPKEISDIIKEKEIAIQDDLRNKQQIETARSKVDLAREEAMKLQKQEKVKAETLIITASTLAEQEKAVALTKANQELEVAKIDTQKAIISAEQKKEVATIAAEKEKSVALINQQRSLTDAKKQEEVAQIRLDETGFQSQSTIAKANADAVSARVLFNADGGLEVRLNAWRQVMSKMAANRLIPRQIIQGTNQVITSEYVKAFVQLMDESLAKHLEYKPMEEELKLRPTAEIKTTPEPEKKE